jgi:hypothetical protein
MEEAGIDWSCKTCKEQVAKAETPPSTNQEELMDTEPAPPPPSDEGGDQETSPTAASTGRRARAAARRQQSGGDSQEAKPKAKAARCHMCSKPPRLSSIYCSGKYGTVKWGPAIFLVLLCLMTHEVPVPNLIVVPDFQ